MEIKSAEFVISNSSVGKCPSTHAPEYAFIGRSNVGKSSLINMLTNNKKLAKTSATPGKTLLINHFLINNEWYLVDLPGYGYARTRKIAANHLFLYTAQRTDDQLVRTRRFATRASKNRHGIHRMARRKRNPVQYCFYESRQIQAD